MTLTRAYQTRAGALSLLIPAITPWRISAEERLRLRYIKLREGEGRVEELREMKTELEDRGLKAWILELEEEQEYEYEWGGTDLLHIYDKWKESEYADTCFQVIQIISGHGCFGSNLVRMGKESPKCLYCYAEDTVKHTLLECVNCRDSRVHVFRAFGFGNLTLADIPRRAASAKTSGPRSPTSPGA